MITYDHPYFKLTSLQGGVIAFWVKTKSRGKGKVEVTIDDQVLQSEVIVS